MQERLVVAKPPQVRRNSPLHDPASGIDHPFHDAMVGITNGDRLARIRIMLTYLWRHRRLPKLSKPTLFTELVQHRKLTDRDPRLPMLSDKVTVKPWIADRIGADWVIPTLWQGTELPEEPTWPLPFVVKSRHGCNQRAFVRSGQEDWSAIRRRARRWTGRNYGRWLDEWAYRDLTPGLLVEPFVGQGDVLPIDYKFYVFGGRVEFVQVHLERENAHRWIQLDRNWRRVSASTADADPPRPQEFARMVVAAETLGRGFDFVRADLYEVGKRPLFGEMTFYPGSGLDPFFTTSLDSQMGRCWLDAIARRSSSPEHTRLPIINSKQYLIQI